MRQRGVARAEIIDGYHQPKRLELMHNVNGDLDVSHHHTFGDLQTHHLRWQARLADGPLDEVDEPGDELMSRHVHANHGRGRRPKLFGPYRLLAARFGEHPLAEKAYEAALLGERYELDRRHHPAGWVLPPDECFDALQATRADVDLRLVVQPQL